MTIGPILLLIADNWHGECVCIVAVYGRYTIVASVHVVCELKG